MSSPSPVRQSDNSSKKARLNFDDHDPGPEIIKTTEKGDMNVMEGGVSDNDSTPEIKDSSGEGIMSDIGGDKTDSEHKASESAVNLEKDKTDPPPSSAGDVE